MESPSLFRPVRAIRARLEAKRMKEWEPTRIWDMAAHRGWGNRIAWSAGDGFARGRMDGHTTPRVSVGDEIRAPMTSGRTARFRVVEVDRCREPADMWFATVEPVGYTDEFEFLPPVTKRGVFG